MFNLIVIGSGWNGNRRVFPRNRVLEYTTTALEEHFKPGRVLDYDAVSGLPTLFMAETGGDGNQAARVGSIVRIREAGPDYALEFSFDSAIPPIPNSKLAELANELEIGDWEFTRTHWAIKDVDLFRVLLRNAAVKGPSPKVFALSEDPIDEDLISVMMPFDASFNDIYNTLEGMARRLGKRCLRVDNIWNHDAIIQEVVSLISRSGVVICDLSGRNANVFYETGIAHTLGRDVILITQSANDVPFDLRHLRFVQYLNNAEGRKRLGEEVGGRIKTLDAAH